MKQIPLYLSGLLLLAGLFAVSQGKQPQGERFFLLMMVLAVEGFWCVAWLLAAWGWGWPLRARLLPKTNEPLVAQAALGIGALLLLDWLLAWGGRLNLLAAWGLGVAGWVLAVRQFHLNFTAAARRRGEKQEAEAVAPRSDRCAFLPFLRGSNYSLPLPLAALALALLFGAATIVPGVLWAGEYYGWDVLSYHLQLPKEWLAHGRMTGLPYTFYSYLPNFLEAGFLHLSLWRGSVLAAVYAAQMLHGALALLAAVAVGRLAYRLARRRNANLLIGGLKEAIQENGVPGPAQAGVLAAACYLAAPGTIVTGSMAFTEQGMLAFGAAALLLAFETEDESCAKDLFRRGLAVGLLCGWAALCKLTALFMLACPVAATLLLMSGGRGWRARAVAGGAFLLGLAGACAPWCLRNFLWTGNPVFPLATEYWGHTHLSGEEVQRFTFTHIEPHKTEGERLGRLWHNCLASVHFGYLLIPCAGVSAWLCLRRTALRRPCLVLLATGAFQLAAWSVCTHQLWRFLIPLLLPVCVLAGLLAAAAQRRWSYACLILLLCWLTTLDYHMYFTQPGAPVAGIDGAEFMAHELEPYKTLNNLPPGSRVYAEAFATPLFVQTPLDYHSFLDASPLGAAFQRGGQAEALRWLRNSGYTHLVIDWGMLATWTAPGNFGYDRNITVPALRAFAASALTPLVEGVHSGISVYALP